MVGENTLTCSRIEPLRDRMPKALFQYRQWVCWMWKERGGKLTKPPYQCDGSPASSTDRSTWCSFDEARTAWERGGFDGIGFVLTVEDPFVAFDLDHCVTPKTGAIEPWAQSIVSERASYAEVTPSGTGVRIIARGKLPEGRRKQNNIEVYDTGRYVTVTGRHLAGTPVTIEDRTDKIVELHRQIFKAAASSPSARKPPPTLALSDEALLEHARKAKNGDKFEALWRGDTNGYSSPSEADLALCSMLAFWTRGDAARVDKLFRRSGLIRPKWDERHGGDGKTYGQITLEKALSAANSRAPSKGSSDPSSVPDKKSLPQGEILTQLCESHIKEFFLDQFQRPHVILPFDNRDEVWPTSAARFRESWMAGLYRKEHGKPPGSEALNQARIQVEARCLEGPKRELHNRVAWYKGQLWYDLADDAWKGVCITPEGWLIQPLPPCFRRYVHQAPQARPLSDEGEIPKAGNLLQFCNVPAENQLLFLVLVASWFVPDIPHPILILHGEQGTAKSTTSRILKQLVDPARGGLELFGVPKDEDRAVQMFDHNWLCPIDNVSKISAWFSDMLCRTVTGEGLTKRALYTDDEDFIRAYRRCVILNGINNPVFRGDLLDRSILIETAPMVHREPENLLMQRWANSRPAILAGFYDILRPAMAVIADVSIESVSEFRMADFARWGAALARGLGHEPDEFRADYRKTIDSKFEDAVENDPLARAIKEVAATRDGFWEGSVSELLMLVNPSQQNRHLPQTPESLGKALTRVAPALRQCGVQVNRGRASKGCRLLSIRVTVG